MSTWKTPRRRYLHHSLYFSTTWISALPFYIYFIAGDYDSYNDDIQQGIGFNMETLFCNPSCALTQCVLSQLLSWVCETTAPHCSRRLL